MNQATLVQRVRFHLGDHPWETVGSAASATSDVVVGDGAEWAKGDIGEFSDGDTFYTRSISGSSLTCVRSYNGSTGATQASGRILKNPKYLYNEITNAVSTVIKAYLPWPRIYKTTADTVTPDATNTSWYDLAADALGIVSIYQLGDATPKQVRTYNEFHQYDRVTFKRNLPTTLVASGVGLRFADGFLDRDNTVYINYAAKITDTVTTGSYVDFSDGDAVTEAIVLGAVQILHRALELRKTRNSDDEPDYIRSGRDFNSLFQAALNTAEKEIRLKTPLMRTSSAS